jgi:glycosyltransferase
MTTFSIITATRNSAATIAGCLASVRSQTLPVEHIIIDGASTDGTLEIVSPLTLHPSPFTRVISEPDRGIYDAMNKGIQLATGEVIGILNSDDMYAGPEVLAKVAALFEDPSVEACYGDLVYVKEAGAGHWALGTGENSSPVTVHRSPLAVVRYWKSGYFSTDRFYWGWMPPHPTFFVRRSVYEKYGVFNLTLGSAADYELMLRFLLRHRINAAYVPEVLVKMRTGGVSNASLAARLLANRMDRKAWETNGLKPYPWTLLCKPLRKLPQWWRRPA